MSGTSQVRGSRIWSWDISHSSLVISHCLGWLNVGDFGYGDDVLLGEIPVELFFSGLVGHELVFFVHTEVFTYDFFSQGVVGLGRDGGRRRPLHVDDGRDREEFLPERGARWDEAA